jgi:chemotaxis protein MotB
MPMQSSEKPIVIKRVRRATKEGHHGGAWKVAYADFVTAMMAFFLLLWLISTTTDEQRRGIADFFAPTVPVPSSHSGGDGPFAGSTMYSEDAFTQDMTQRPRQADIESAEGALTDPELWAIEDALKAMSGDALDADPLLDHIRTRLTDEGLIIEVFDIDGSPLFEPATARPTLTLERIVAMIGSVLETTVNPVAVAGHIGAPSPGVDPWTLSADRAQAVRTRLVAAGVRAPRIARVAGHADRRLANEDPTDPRNRRIEITLLRRFGG